MDGRQAVFAWEERTVEGGRLRVPTPPDPRTGLVEKILDPLEPIHALTTQIRPRTEHGPLLRLVLEPLEEGPAPPAA